MSSISIIGVGNMASALAGRALAGRNAVEIIGRDPAKAKELAAALGSATVGTPGTAPAGDIVILAVPYASAANGRQRVRGRTARQGHHRHHQPVNADFTGSVTSAGSSGAQEIAKAAPEGAHVVKAFNTLFFNVLAAGPAEGRPLDVFIAGDDAQAKAACRRSSTATSCSAPSSRRRHSARGPGARPHRGRRASPRSA